jgi:hypothetical protein
MKHVILELHCLYLSRQDAPLVPGYCKNGPGNEGIHCMEGDGNKCPYIGYCAAGNELAYSQGNGEIDKDAWIGFGGEMEVQGKDIEAQIDIWESICKEKIAQAYDEYNDAVK